MAEPYYRPSPVLLRRALELGLRFPTLPPAEEGLVVSYRMANGHEFRIRIAPGAVFYPEAMIVAAHDHDTDKNGKPS